MDKKDQDRLLEIILKRGIIGNDLFNYDRVERERFLTAYGLSDVVDRHDKVEFDYNISDNLTETARYKEKLKATEKEIADICKKVLVDGGLDVDTMIGHLLNEKETKDELLQQLKQFGISPEMATTLGLDDPDLLKREGKEFIFEVRDTPKNRESLAKNEILFEKKDGKLRINGRFEVKEGIAYDDTQMNRKLLDENEMEYIKFAQGEYSGDKMKNKLLVPINWGNAAFPVTNSNLVLNLEKMAMLGASAFVLSPTGAIVLLLVLQKSGLYQQLNKPAELKPGEMEALRNGLTVYKEDEKGNSRYYYMDKGNVCSLDTRNVRLSNVYNGIKLSAAQMDMLRKGKLVTFTDKKGEEIGLRIDVSKSGGLQEYYRGMYSGNEMKRKPTNLSSDIEKLEWVKRNGLQGIKDIYGKKSINLELENFLGRHNLSQAYRVTYEAKGRMDMATKEERETLMKEFIKEDNILKNKADEALSNSVKINKGMGR